LEAESLQTVRRLSYGEIAAAYPIDHPLWILASRSTQASTRLAVLDPQSFEAISSWTLNSPYATWISVP